MSKFQPGDRVRMKNGAGRGTVIKKTRVLLAPCYVVQFDGPGEEARGPMTLAENQIERNGA